MKTFILPALHVADVILKGKRRESRETFRIDVPVQIRELKRSDLETAIRIDLRSKGVGAPIELQADREGRYMVPRLPSGGVEIRSIGDDREALDEDGVRAIAVDPMRYRYGHSDPFPRLTTVVRNRRDTPVTQVPTIEDAAVKEVIWSSAGKEAANLQRSADELAFVDGKLWKVVDEPCWSVDDINRRRTAMIEIVGAAYHNSWYALRHFRLDRLDAAHQWFSSPEGKSTLPVKGGAAVDELDVVDRYELTGRTVLRRDDARFIAESRVSAIRGYAGDLVGYLPANAVDAYLRLVRFAAKMEPERSRPMPDTYEDLRILHSALERVHGLGDRAEGRRDRARRYTGPALARWDALEAALHPQGTLGVDEPARAVVAAL